MQKDIILRGLIADSAVNFIAISGREMVKKARDTHNLSRVCTAALGRTLLVSSMMGAQMKNETDRVTNIVKGGGPAGNIVCTAYMGGIVKGYIENPEIELPLGPDGKLDVSSAVGWYGDLTVIRDLSLKEPYIGNSRMVSGEIAEDFANHFALSEQQPSLVYLGVRVAPQDGAVLSAGGLMLQPLPFCDERVLDALQEKAQEIQGLSGELAQGAELEAVLERLFGGMGFAITERSTPLYACDCSRERLERVLVSLGDEELQDMIEKDGGAELKCQFCNTVYRFNTQDLSALYKEARSEDDGE